MAESNATQVILTDDGLKIINAQNTADSAASQAGNADSAALIAQSTANAAKSAADSNYNYANSEIAVQSNATAKAQSTADNAFSKAQEVGSQADSEIAVQSTATAKAQSTADNAFSQAQAVGSQADSEIAVQSTATAKAQSTADNAFSQAQAVGSQASAEINSNSTATAKAQSTADNAFSQATTAIDNGKVTSQAVTDLKDGSTLTIDQLGNGLATKVSSSDYASYKEQTASQIASKVDNGAFSAYQTQTADLIASKVATDDFSTYKDQTAKSIDSKVESKDFNTYKTQTADLIDSKVSNSAYASDKTQTASEIADRVSNSAFSAYQTQTASQIASKVDNGDFSTYKTQTADLIGSKVDNGVYQSDKTQTAKDIASKVSSSDFSTYKTQTAELIDDKVSSSEYASDKAQTASQISQMVSNSAFSAYQTQTASQIAQTVSNSAFSAYQAQTADLIASKVATDDFSTYKDQTAKSIDSKVESDDFNTYKTQTADLINDKVSNSAYASDKTQTASEIADRVSNSAFSTYQEQTASQIASKVDNGDFSTYKTQTADLISSKVATKDFNTYTSQTATAIDSKVATNDFNTYKTQTDKLISSKVSSIDFNNLTISNRNLALGTATSLTVSGANKSNQLTSGYKFSSVIPNGTIVTVAFDIASSTGVGTYRMQFNGNDSGGSWQTISTVSLVNGTKHVSATITTIGNNLHVYPRLDNATGTITLSNFIISESSKEVDWTPAPEDLATQSQITQLSGDINLRVTKDDLIDQINLQAGKTLISSSGQLTLAADTIYFDTKKPVIIPSANITGTLNGKTITGSTINGTTFNGGDRINDANNTSSFYPFTIEPNGKASTTSFNSMDAFRTEMSGGGLRTMYRAINASGSQYEAYDGSFDGNLISLNSGFTNGKDMSFSQSVTGDQLTGQVTLSPLNGINLWGSTQSIHFSGRQMNGTGVTFNSYGNIIGDVGSTWWRVIDSSGNQVANFGTAPGNNTTFPKPIFVDEIGAYSSNNGHALFIHGNDDGKSGSTGQMLFRKDSRSAHVVSASIYNRTYSGGSNVKVTSYGTLGRVTSASKYKLDITKETSISPANRLLSIDMSSWIDKSSAELLADSKTNGTELSEPEINVNRHYGLIAEDLIKAGLDEFVIKGDKGQAEGIEYDRLWITLIPKIRQLSNENIQNKMTISKLESEIKELKQGR
ncbi:hypothetical protein [Lactiplantibacillus pentosus]|uniref:hypothetical protein n=2 Tax=Lactiplantibacillus pentosus TaxID=1589 RepID=UPI001C1F4BFB|nr:hypothetical protein [Lactiplantibacillus pentosus]MBU7504155.1 hypothetical protein [Lactiplantibacillus pentosus]MDY1544098.1 hypothetical protein [Lactiplantibacillus pentosus]